MLYQKEKEGGAHFVDRDRRTWKMGCISVTAAQIVLLLVFASIIL